MENSGSTTSFEDVNFILHLILVHLSDPALRIVSRTFRECFDSLVKCLTVNSFKCDDIRGLLPRFPNLTHLCVSGFESIEEFDFVATCISTCRHSLVYLKLEGFDQVVDLSPHITQPFESGKLLRYH